ncbi:SDR family NAD(P)-dependent oxidoreductase [Allokutzneria sp. A3M-2-11 16]|uniref:type I polyketide synthase n=1 Tax=Allokutzneria sp. A3M-2-11 16 TaxID=2962043 RepID=UPI0020B6BDD7|nr:type I polyketide synthase [Allokutzneria sp. A3M-2-11 16]MCP3800854.1 SDR family NAD(P)-dependent oxidoreductase [Allokutzneria sp. A3M-2-11 16]
MVAEGEKDQNRTGRDVANEDSLAGSSIAIVGIACRLPEAGDPVAFWELLRSGTDAISQTSAGRAGRLAEVDGFDPAFFGISPREAAAMDPQQRLALELSWEALEDAGLPADSLAGQRAGVFVGAIGDDYATLLHRAGAGVGQHTLTGLNRGMIANRVSYLLGLRGPSMVVDSGQSSSLVAVHMACESIRNGDADIALAGGVTLNLAPESTLGAAAFGALSPDGRCYTFDARANGYVRGEGGGVVVLKPLHKALADGDPIYCVVAGGAVNNDGGGDTLTTPDRAGQEDLLRAAYRRAGIDPATVKYVELHGTGTRVGDPVEAGALGAVLGAARPSDAPLLVGSAKTNVGHLEGAAGITGLIKAALAVRNRELPPSLNFETPNPDIDMDALNLRVQTELGQWSGEIIAGVSSFGMGGTNCHLVLTEAPQREAEQPGAAPSILPWVLSARSPKALRAQASRLLSTVDEEDVLDVANSLATTRAALTHRIGVVGRDRDELISGLRAYADGMPHAAVVEGRVGEGKTAFLFTGQGAQRVGMGRELHAAFPVFAKAFDEIVAAFDMSLDEIIANGNELDQTQYTQPALFAIEVALFRLAESWGLRPDYLSGHSIGEIAAAHVAGVLSLTDAVKLVTARGRLMQALPTGGAMVSLQASEADILPLLNDKVSIAALNGPQSTVIAGDEEAVLAIAAASGVKSKRLTVSHAFHSPLMEPMLDEFREVAASLTYSPPTIPIVSGNEVEQYSADYWVEHVRGTVRFYDSVRFLEENGVTRYLELGPHGVLTAAAKESLSSTDGITLVPLLRKDRAEDESALSALVSLHTSGVAVDWKSFFAATGARRVALPTYAFQRQRYWLDAAVATGTAVVANEVPEPETEDLPILWQKLADVLEEEEQQRISLDMVRALVASVLGYADLTAVDPDLPFKDLGFDSLTAVELRDRLSTGTGLNLPSSLLFNYPTPRRLSEHTLDQFLGRTEEAALEAGSKDLNEPIAIVAMGCRFPGNVNSPEQLWEVLANGRDLVGEFPAERGWDIDAIYDPDPDKTGKSYVREGGFLRQAHEFDPTFFGISAREAMAMDPQQRVLMETAWESLERAGLTPKELRGSRAGVFVGAMPQDYGPRMYEAGEGVEGYLLTGTTTSVASGRIAYTLGLEGPAVTVDTACSSSLVAVHMAVQSLRTGECTLALAGGVTVMPNPGIFIELTRQRALSPSGRCRAFSADADGTGWAEGAGMLVLEKLSDAQRNGHQVLAVIRGSAMNQDGASNGLTAPNGLAQVRVIRQALANAGLNAEDVDAVEAHGTGTKLGDPIEANALLSTYGRDREKPVWLGSLKSNTGHTQAAAGVGGIIKMVMALRHNTLPKTLHVTEPTTHVDWSSGAVKLLTEAQPWHSDRPRRAAISSFGISGTNAHAIIEEAPQATVHSAEEVEGPVPFVLSGKSEAALKAQADQLWSFVDAQPELGLHGFARSLATTRSSFDQRAAVVAKDRVELLCGLDALVNGEPAANVSRGNGADGRKVVFVFPGQGSQWPDMALELWKHYPIFRDQVLACDEALRSYTDWSIVDVLLKKDGAPSLERIDVIQPVLFAMMTGLAQLWRSHGVQPSAVVGHSQGEVAAAFIAGALTLDEACRIIARRSQAWSRLSGKGGMLSVLLPADEIRPHLEQWSDSLGIAAVNSHSSATISGSVEALEALSAELTELGVKCRRVPGLDTAGHSPQVDVLREQLYADLEGIEPLKNSIPFYSTVTGDVLAGQELDTDYWYRNIRESVDFERTTRALLAAGHTAFIEVSPHPMLAMAMQETIEDSGTDAVTVGTMRRDEGGRARLMLSLADAYSRGVTVSWGEIFGAGPTMDLPTYPFQRQRYWLEVAQTAGDLGAAGLSGTAHPLLGTGTALPASDGYLFTGRLSLREEPWLADHQVAGLVVAPPSLLVEFAVAAGDLLGCDEVEELTLDHPLVVQPSCARMVQVVLGGPDDSGRRRISIFSRPDTEVEVDDQQWTQHATGIVATGAEQADFDLSEWPPTDANPVDVTGVYADLTSRGLGCGPALQGLRKVWRRGEEVFAEVAIDAEHHADAAEFVLHPALLGAALHAAGVNMPADPGEPMIAMGWQGVVVHANAATALRVRLVPTTMLDPASGSSGGGRSYAMTVANPTGMPVITARTVSFDALDIDLLRTAGSPADDALFRTAWQPVPLPSEPAGGRWTRLGADCFGLDAVLGTSGRPSTLDDLQLLIDAGGDVPDVVVVQFGPDPLDDGDLPTAVRTVTYRALELLQHWLADERFENSGLLLVTKGAMATEVGADVTDLAAGALWGLVRSAQSENPGRVVIVDLDSTTSTAESRQALRRVMAVHEPQLALRGGKLLAPRLSRVEAKPQKLDLDPEGTVLITGATGVLAGLLASHLVTEHGVKHLLMASRSGLHAEGAVELALELAEFGATVRFAACDAADRDAVKVLLDSIYPEHPLTGVVHTAGVLDDGILAALTPQRVDTVLRPKVDAVMNLHELTKDLDLPLFALYSSMVASFGNPGQANYAAANAFLDALATHRRANGLSGVSLGWGFWAQRSGMSDHLTDADVQRMARSGVVPLASEEGLSLFDAAAGAEDAALLPVRLDTATLRNRISDPALSPLMRGLVKVPQRRNAATAINKPAEGASALADRLAGLSPADQDRAVLDLVRTQAAAVIAHPDPDALEPKRAFKEVGFDSLTAVELRNRLSEASGLKLPTTLLFDYPTPAVLAEFLRSQALGERKAGAAPATVTRVVQDDDPIAIVSMSCRLPGGVRSPEQLWEMLTDGRDAMGLLPTDRGWDEDLYDPNPDSHGKTYSRVGGFLYDAGEFDPAFFGISPREALAMDPQQRVLLETAWEALERGGVAPSSVSGEQVGVYVGTNGQDYAGHLTKMPADLEGYLLTGKAASVVSGRISYILGTEGPSITLDTACSSSLVAIHLACQALRQGECDLALAGGVTVMSMPSLFVEFSRQRGLAKDGRVKAFSDGADGTSWSEGAGMLLLERLSDARARGHKVLAVVRGSAVNQDGASNGLAAPNGPSQQRVIRQALANAGVAPSEVDLVEAHGTGTVLGDPIEAQALLATYGQDRDRPVQLGALKSNIGHTQAASGVAGVIKLVLAMQHGIMPKTLNAEVPSTHVDWSAGDVTLLTEAMEWPEREGPRLAGISAFGISGTNAHAIIEQAPVEADGAVVADREISMLPWTLSARSEKALRAQASLLRERAEEGSLLDLAYSLATTRTAFEYRATIVGSERDELLNSLAALAEGDGAFGVVNEGKTAFLFTGQGAQRAGMGRALCDAFPVYAKAFDEVAAELDKHMSKPLVDVLDSDELSRTEFTQPALFAVEVALFRLVSEWGLTPDFLAGHSIGEIAAAHVAGVLSLADAAKLVTARGRLMQALPAGGAMVSLQAAEADVLPLLEGRDDVGVAAINGPLSTVIAGAEEPVLAVAEASGVKSKRLNVSHAFHSPLMEPMIAEFRDLVAGLELGESTIPIVSTVTGEIAQLDDPEYWVTHVRNEVRFLDAVRFLEKRGVTRFLELGPDAILTAAARDCLTTEKAVVAAAMRRNRSEEQTLLIGVTELYGRGAELDWQKFFAGTGARWTELPTYAFQHERFWYQPPKEEVSLATGSTDAEFWEIVQNGDPDALRSFLDVDADRPLSELLPALSEWRRRNQERSTVDSWRYRAVWRPQPEVHEPALPGAWVVLTPEPGIGGHAVSAAVKALETFGARVSTVEFGAAEADRELAAVKLKEATASEPISGVLSLLGLDERPHPEHPALSVGLAATIGVVQAMHDMDAKARLWLATSGAVVTGDEDGAINPAQTSLWGLGRVLGLEQPQRLGALIDLPQDLDERALYRFACALSAPTDDDQLAIRSSGTFAQRLVHADGDNPTGAEFLPWGTVLITGGTGGLAGHVARWLARNGVERLVLTSRRGPDAPGAAELVAELEALGAWVTVAACDTADRDQLASLITEVEKDGPIRSVFHTAGVVRFAPLAETSLDEVAEVAVGKVIGAAHLDELFADRDLDAFVLFSSVAAVWGSGGQGGYAAANAFLDSLAERRRARGQKAMSIAWGPWADDGMIRGEGVEEHLARRGLVPMAPELAVTSLKLALDNDDTCLAVADMNWERFVPGFTAGRARPMLDELPAVKAMQAEAAQPEPAPDAFDFAKHLAGLPKSEQARELLDMVRAQAAAVLGHASADAVAADRAFKEVGFDSLMAVELRDRLHKAVGLRLSAMMIFDYPDPQALSEYIRGELLPEQPETLPCGTPASVFVELDRIESALPGIEADPALRAELAARFADLASRLGAASKVDDRLGDDASAEDVFRFIDELGS